MSFYLPKSLNEAVRVLAENPSAQVLGGGTDFMVEVNYRHRRPEKIVSLRMVAELRGWRKEERDLVLGAGLKYSDILGSDLVTLAPALAQAARTVGSPQIRNAGTIGGNIATASPAGDTLPVLAALDAKLTLSSLNGERTVSIDNFIKGVKKTDLAPGELISAIHIPIARGPQEFLKIGKRNAMVIAVSNIAVAVDMEKQSVTCSIGSVGPTVLRCTEAEVYANRMVDWTKGKMLEQDTASSFGRLCAEASMPIDDHRAAANYRRHSISVMAERALARCF